MTEATYYTFTSDRKTYRVLKPLTDIPEIKGMSEEQMRAFLIREGYLGTDLRGTT